MLNQNLMRQPFIDKDIEIKLNYDILNIYKKLVRGDENIDFSPKSNTVCINRSDIKVDNWEKWMQEVIWYGHRSGAYLYKCESDIDNQKVELSTKDLGESLNLSN